ncbi:MAG: hypothetical protein EB078_09045 [Proteobacteria bacterium]|nr:hypothetical protein [Pseudomonadota bacterium]
MSEQIFDSYDEAQKYSLTIPWKLTICNTGESCWCRIILPTEKILYKNIVGDTERIDEFEYIIPDGSIDKETAEYIIDLHNRSVNLYKSQKKRLQALQKLNDLDQELGLS